MHSILPQNVLELCNADRKKILMKVLIKKFVLYEVITDK